MNLGFRAGEKRVGAIARRLYDTAVAQGRQSALYATMGAPDTVEGRFEILTLHVILLLERLKATGDRDRDRLAQALFDVYLSDLDGALREMSVGDLAVGKRMRKLGEAFYGRARAYGDAFVALPDLGALEALIARTVLDDPGGGDAHPLAMYVARAREGLAANDTAALLGGSAAWPTP
jgi:cytochrome b pre-mRNA-processing protein 3